MTGVNVVFLFVTVGLRVSVGQVADPCQSHTLLKEDWRRPESNEDPVHCDNMTEAWYAFQIDDTPAVIPFLCLQDNSCGTRVPLHVDLEGQAGPEVGENVTASLCGSYNVLGGLDCCVQRQPVVIKRCSQDLFVYWLRPQGACPVAVCAKRYGSSILPQYTAKPRDIPRSLMPFTTRATTQPEVTTTTAQRIVRTLGTLAPAPSPSPSAFPSSPSPTGDPSSNSSVPFLPSAIPPVHPDGSDDSPASSNSSDVFSSSNDTADGVTGSFSPGPPIFQQVSSGGNATDLVPTGISNNMAPGWMPNNVTSGYNASVDDDDKLEGVATPEAKRTSEIGGTTVRPMTTSDDVKDRSTTKTVAVEAAGTGAAGLSTPVQSSVAGSSSPGAGGRVTAPPVTGGAGGMTASVPSSTPEMLSSEAVRFVLIGTYEESEFRDALLLFVNNMSRLLTYGHVDHEEGVQGRGAGVGVDVGVDVSLQNMTLRAQTFLPTNITVVDVLVSDPTTNGTIPAQRFVTIIQNDNFAELLFSQTGQTLIRVCPSVDHCDLHADSDTPLGGHGSGDDDRQSLFHRNRGVFIAVIAVAALCLLALLLGLLILRCKRRGVWVLAPDQEEKGGDPLAIESPMTDHQILHGEGGSREGDTPLTVNGDHHHHHHHHASPTTTTTAGATTSPAAAAATSPDSLQYSDIPAADEDNGWVVPLDQAPPPSAQGLADKTEDTQF